MSDALYDFTVTWIPLSIWNGACVFWLLHAIDHMEQR